MKYDISSQLMELHLSMDTGVASDKKDHRSKFFIEKRILQEEKKHT